MESYEFNNKNHYTQFQNIFLYITQECQLKCKHCYMGSRLNNGLNMSKDYAQNILLKSRRLGAKYVTILGGEPSLIVWLRDQCHQLKINQ